MSITNQPGGINPSQRTAQNAVSLILRGRSSSIGDLPVSRMLPSRACRRVGPFIFLDEMGPVTFQAGEGIDVKPHPHIHLATLTWLLEGQLIHRDSLGSHQVISPFEVNLMRAGKGIVHSERQSAEIKADVHQFHGLQFWLALPEETQGSDPAFYHYPARQIPQVTSSQVEAHIIMGRAFGMISPVKCWFDTLLVSLILAQGAEHQLPLAQERAVYVISGQVELRDAILEKGDFGILSSDADALLARKDSHCIVMGGEAISERYFDWNFASTDKTALVRAVAAWKAGQFPSIPDDNEEHLAYPGK